MKQSSTLGLSRSSTRIGTDVSTMAGDAAKRIFEQLEAEEQAQKTATGNNKNHSSANDSGFNEDSVESWRMQAESRLHEDFVLTGEKTKLLEPEPMSELALKFLRPAPAKMSLRPGYIKKNLFPEYKSVPPPDEDEFKQLDKLAVGGFQKRTLRLNGKKTRSERTHTAESEEEDSDEDDDLEGQLILEK